MYIVRSTTFELCSGRLCFLSPVPRTDARVVQVNFCCSHDFPIYSVVPVSVAYLKLALRLFFCMERIFQTHIAQILVHRWAHGEIMSIPNEEVPQNGAALSAVEFCPFLIEGTLNSCLWWLLSTSQRFNTKSIDSEFLLSPNEALQVVLYCITAHWPIHNTSYNRMHHGTWKWCAPVCRNDITSSLKTTRIMRDYMSCVVPLLPEHDNKKNMMHI